MSNANADIAIQMSSQLTCIPLWVPIFSSALHSEVKAQNLMLLFQVIFMDFLYYFAS